MGACQNTLLNVYMVLTECLMMCSWGDERPGGDPAVSFSIMCVSPIRQMLSLDNISLIKVSAH